MQNSSCLSATCFHWSSLGVHAFNSNLLWMFRGVRGGSNTREENAVYRCTTNVLLWETTVKNTWSKPLRFTSPSCSYGLLVFGTGSVWYPICEGVLIPVSLLLKDMWWLSVLALTGWWVLSLERCSGTVCYTHEQARLPVIFVSDSFHGKKSSRIQVFGEEVKQDYFFCAR